MFVGSFLGCSLNTFAGVLVEIFDGKKMGVYAGIMIEFWVGGIFIDGMGNSVSAIAGIAVEATDLLQLAQVTLQYASLHTRMSESVE